MSSFLFESPPIMRSAICKYILRALVLGTLVLVLGTGYLTRCNTFCTKICSCKAHLLSAMLHNNFSHFKICYTLQFSRATDTKPYTQASGTLRVFLP